MKNTAVQYTLLTFGEMPSEGTHIVLGIDARFIRGASVCMASAAHNTTRPVCAHIIYGQQDVADDVRRVFEQLVEMCPHLCIQVYAIQDFAADFLTTNSLSSAMYYRYAIGEILHGITARVVYLDADIVVDCDLDPLYRQDMQGCVLGAVEDYVPDGDEFNHERMKAFYDGAYFNSGMLLIDVDRWHQDGIFEKAITLTEAKGHLLKHKDQDVLNIVFAHQWQMLDRTWNCIDYQQALCSEVVAHYIGSAKPWLEWCDPKAAALYDRYEAMTPFAGHAKQTPRWRKAKEAKHYKRYLWKQGQPVAAIKWECLYFLWKYAAA